MTRPRIRPNDPNEELFQRMLLLTQTGDFAHAAYLSNRGYWTVNLNGKLQAIHRRIALSNLPLVDGNTEVNHIDGCKANNFAANLEWSNRSANLKHAYRTGLKVHAMTGKSGALNKYSQPVCGFNPETGELVYFESMKLSKAAGYQPAAIGRVLKNLRKTHKNMKWIAL